MLSRLRLLLWSVMRLRPLLLLLLYLGGVEPRSLAKGRGEPGSPCSIWTIVLPMSIVF